MQDPVQIHVRKLIYREDTVLFSCQQFSKTTKESISLINVKNNGLFTPTKKEPTFSLTVKEPTFSLTHILTKIQVQYVACTVTSTLMRIGYSQLNNES